MVKRTKRTSSCWKIDIKSETDAREAGIYPVVEAEKVTEEDVALEDADTTESTEEVTDVSVETNVEKNLNNRLE